MFSRSLFAALVLAVASGHAAEPRAWETWDKCELESDKYFDGDSFHVKRGPISAIIRLYFVDAPEADDTYKDRLAEQAAFFRSSPAAVLRAGAAAKELTARFLDQPFRVITSRQVAPGASRNERYYGIVDRNGRRLDALLVEAGLARVSGETAEYPDAAAGTHAVHDLRALELKASQARRGLWRRGGFVEDIKDALKPRGAAAGGASAAKTIARRINLNTASATELAALPGIGPKTAEQIIRARPFKNLDDLDALPGIGPKKLEALRDLVSFE